MLLRTARYPLLRLLVVALLVSFVPPLPAPHVVVASSAPQSARSVAPITAPRTQPMPSVHVPQIMVNPRNETAHAEIPPRQSPNLTSQNPPDQATLAQAGAVLRQLPLAFMPNVGQTGAAVRFHVQSFGGTLFFPPNEIVMTLPTSPDLRRRDEINASPHMTATLPISRSIVRVRYEGANQKPRITPADHLPGTVNYLVGKQAKAWRTDIPTYSGLVYEQLLSCPRDLVKMDVAVAPDGRRIVARGTYDQTLWCVGCGGDRLTELLPLPNVRVPLDTGNVLIHAGLLFAERSLSHYLVRADSLAYN